MPYIEESEKIQVEPRSVREAASPGELNYQITVLCLRYIAKHGKNYTTLNAVVGVFECAKLELYRRVVVPYEQHKAEVNGDVY